MRHFSSEEWADFVRNVIKTKDKEEMQAHLRSGCKRCASALATWTRVNELAARENAYEPPTAAVRTAKSLMVMREPGRSLVASLLFDSWQSPAVAGIRSGSAAARQMLYGFEDYRVDLRLEPRFDTDQVLLVGQVLRAASDARDLGEVGVTLMRGGRVFGLAQTNELGEFQLECDLAGRLDLLLTLSTGEVVNIPIIEPANAGGQPSGRQHADFERLSKVRQRSSKRTRN